MDQEDEILLFPDDDRPTVPLHHPMWTHDNRPTTPLHHPMWTHDNRPTSPLAESLLAHDDRPISSLSDILLPHEDDIKRPRCYKKRRRRKRRSRKRDLDCSLQKESSASYLDDVPSEYSSFPTYIDARETNSVWTPYWDNGFQSFSPQLLVMALVEWPDFQASLLHLVETCNAHPTSIRRIVSENTHIFSINSDMVFLHPTVEICTAHLSQSGCHQLLRCNDIHVCPGFVWNECSEDYCPLGHKFRTNHNLRNLSQYYLELLNSSVLKRLFRTLFSPLAKQGQIDLCEDYNKGKCERENCNSLHMCMNYVTGRMKCSNQQCDLNHNLLSEECCWLLRRYGIDTNETPRDLFAVLLEENPSIGLPKDSSAETSRESSSSRQTSDVSHECYNQRARGNNSLNNTKQSEGLAFSRYNYEESANNIAVSANRGDIQSSSLPEALASTEVNTGQSETYHNNDESGSDQNETVSNHRETDSSYTENDNSISVITSRVGIRTNTVNQRIFEANTSATSSNTGTSVHDSDLNSETNQPLSGSHNSTPASQDSADQTTDSETNAAATQESDDQTIDTEGNIVSTQDDTAATHESDDHTIDSEDATAATHESDDHRTDSDDNTSPELQRTTESPPLILQGPSYWSHHLEGDVMVAEICYDSVESTCPRENFCCPRLHSTRHYHWQVSEDDYSWLNLLPSQVTFLERSFCDPGTDTITLPILEPSLFDASMSILLLLMGSEEWTANFQGMVLMNMDETRFLYLRRLSTEIIPGINVGPAIYRWYHCNPNNVWVEYGEETGEGYDDNCFVNSEAIESQFMINPHSYAQFTISDCEYNLDFNTMTQINLNTEAECKVRRRPKPHLPEEEETQS